jgi:hypothetical protein
VRPYISITRMSRHGLWISGAVWQHIRDCVNPGSAARALPKSPIIANIPFRQQDIRLLQVPMDYHTRMKEREPPLPLKSRPRSALPILVGPYPVIRPPLTINGDRITRENAEAGYRRLAPSSGISVSSTSEPINHSRLSNLRVVECLRGPTVPQNPAHPYQHP